MKKRFFALILAAAMTFGALTSAVFAASVKVYVDNRELSTDQPPVIIDGRTLVPLRAIFEALGAEVDWDGDTKTVTSTKGSDTVKMTIGDSKFTKNGETRSLDVPAQIINSRTMVPVRAISEAYGCSVDWDNDTKTVSVYSAGKTPVTPVSSDDKEGKELLSEFKGPFYFSSGAGGWGTGIDIHPDGSFDGDYHDTDMGDTGPGYNATIYYSSFSGHFSIPKKVNDYTYSMELLDLKYDEAIGNEEIKDGAKYVFEKAYGIDGGKTFYIYTPDTPVSVLSEDLKMWFSAFDKEKLGIYGICNPADDFDLGFRSQNGVEAAG